MGEGEAVKTYPQSAEVREILRLLDTAVAKLPRESREQQWAVHEFQRMLGDMFPMLTWWKEEA